MKDLYFNDIPFYENFVYNLPEREEEKMSSMIVLYGTYTIKETASNGKYRLTDGTAHELKIREDNMTYESTWKDEVVKRSK